MSYMASRAIAGNAAIVRLARSVPCPYCLADPGVVCQNRRGQPLRLLHSKRWEAARAAGVLPTPVGS